LRDLHDSHNFYSFKVSLDYEAYRKRLQCAPTPGTENDVPFHPGDLEADVIPPEDEWLAKLVDVAVREVGWAPRDVYKFLRNYNGMFFFFLEEDQC
jgi:hypothetical protein